MSHEFEPPIVDRQGGDTVTERGIGRNLAVSDEARSRRDAGASFQGEWSVALEQTASHT